MFAQDTKYSSIDQHYAQYLQNNADVSEKWLLEQTLLSGSSRRGVLSMLPLFPGARILDIGTGFGALAFDLAASSPVSVTAIDLDSRVLASAMKMYDNMQHQGCFESGSNIDFQFASVYELPFEDQSFDLILARFVYQHLDKPQLATSEIARVLKSGGYVCLMDADDQLTMTYPESTAGFPVLQSAVAQLQGARNGDRQVGRKLAGYIHQAGIAVAGTLIYPNSQFTTDGMENPGLALTIRRFEELRDAIVDGAILSLEEFDYHLLIARRTLNAPAFHASGIVVALGQKGNESETLPADGAPENEFSQKVEEAR